jgi:hypothetical protein
LLVDDVLFNQLHRRYKAPISPSHLTINFRKMLRS